MYDPEEPDILNILHALLADIGKAARQAQEDARNVSTRDYDRYYNHGRVRGLDQSREMVKALIAEYAPDDGNPL